MRIEDGGGWDPTTNFEQMSHQQLHDMVANSDPANITSIADTLQGASDQVQSIANDLATHLTKLQWDSPSADAFRAWGRQVVQAMDDLATFHGNAAQAAQTAGSTLHDVKSAMPPVPTAEMAIVAQYIHSQMFVAASAGHAPTVINGRVQPPSGIGSTSVPLVGSITQQQAYDAQTAVDKAHQDAIAQMDKLGGAYVGAKSTMDINAEPVFPPPPQTMMPPRGSGYDSTTTVSGPTGSTGNGNNGTNGTNGNYGTVGSNGNTGSSGTHGGMVVRQPIGQGPGSTLQGTQPPTTGTGTGTVQPPGGGAPGGTGTGGGGKTGGGVGVITPPGLGGTGRLGGGSGTGRPGSSGGFGEGEGGGSVGESGIGGGLKGDTGISGGMAESGFGSGGGGVGGGIGGRGLGGSVGGSSESGMTAGEGATGSSTARAGYSSEDAGAAAGGAAAGESSTSGGMMGGGGLGGLASAAGRGRKRGGRAGYLAEDEETWNKATGQSNPAVIE